MQVPHFASSWDLEQVVSFIFLWFLIWHIALCLNCKFLEYGKLCMYIGTLKNDSDLCFGTEGTRWYRKTSPPWQGWSEVRALRAAGQKLLKEHSWSTQGSGVRMGTCSNHKVKKMAIRKMKKAAWFWIFPCKVTHTGRVVCGERSWVIWKQICLPRKDLLRKLVTDMERWQWNSLKVLFHLLLFSFPFSLFEKEFLYTVLNGIEFTILQLWPPELWEWEAGAITPEFISMLKREKCPNSINISAICLWGANSRGKTGNIMLPKIIKFQNSKKIVFWATKFNKTDTWGQSQILWSGK